MPNEPTLPPAVSDFLGKITNHHEVLTFTDSLPPNTEGLIIARRPDGDVTLTRFGDVSIEEANFLLDIVKQMVLEHCLGR